MGTCSGLCRFLCPGQDTNPSSSITGIGRWRSSMTECLLILRWVAGSFPHRKPIELFPIPTSAPQLGLLSCLWKGDYKESLLLTEKSSGGRGFQSRYLNGSLPENHKLNVLSASLNNLFCLNVFMFVQTVSRPLLNIATWPLKLKQYASRARNSLLVWLITIWPWPSIFNWFQLTWSWISDC